MQEKDQQSSRRAMMMGLGASVAAASAAAMLSPVTANAQTRSGFEPPRHGADAWLDEVPGDHRIFIDAATGLGAAEGLLYSFNLNNATRSTYAGESASLALVICLRHFATPFAFSDAMWEKYGEIFHTATNMADPNTNAAPRINLMRTSGYGLGLPNFGNTIDSVRGLGAEIVICDAATQFLSSQIAPATGQQIVTVYDELKANAVPGRFVSAGVMALTRAQEYGYSVLHAGS